MTLELTGLPIERVTLVLNNICIFSLWILSSSELSDMTKSDLSIFQCLPTNQPVTSNTGLAVQLL